MSSAIAAPMVIARGPAAGRTAALETGVPDAALDADGLDELPKLARDLRATGSLGIYVHVPYCAARCGYCDFNTYLADELDPAAGPAAWAAAAQRELTLAAAMLGSARPVSSVFFGGGTPTFVAVELLERLLDGIREQFGLAVDAEITIEANPESVSPKNLRRLVDAGVNRASVGMQSAVPHVLAALDRRHTPGGVSRAVAAARDAGVRQVSVDLIYGAPGESHADWETTVLSALGLQPDHVSAYALTVEPGTRLARQVRRGKVAAPEEDTLAERYDIVDRLLSAAGYDWYEISNWARPGAECRHNLGYWQGGDWWGIGPGAHSHLGLSNGELRWWNVRHPATYAARLAAGRGPWQDHEVVTGAAQRLERLMLAVRLRDGLGHDDLTSLAGPDALPRVRSLARDGLVVLSSSRITLTRRGRLLADAVVHRLLP